MEYLKTKLHRLDEITKVSAISDGKYQASTRSADNVDAEWFESFVEFDNGLAARHDGACDWVGLARS